MKNFSITLVLVALFALPFTSNAQTCARILTTKTGKVYSANPGTVTATSSSDQVTIRIRKTAGRAEAQVNVYINGQMQANPIEYDNGTYIPSGWQSRTYNNTQGKTIMVKVVNQSVANTISYELKIIENSRNVTTTGGKVSGRLLGQTNKTIYTNNSCTGKARIIVRRTGGNARGNIRVWQKVGTQWQLMTNHTYTLEQSQNKKIFVVNSNRDLKVELRNVSVGNTLSYIMNALATN